MIALQPVTGTEVGLNGDSQVHIALDTIAKCGGVAQMKDIYFAMEIVLNQKGYTLSDQGKASLRFFVNKVAVEKGYIYPHDKKSPGWHLTPQGQEFLATTNVSVITIHDHAVDDTKFPEELPDGIEYQEGVVQRISVNRYERDKKARDACLAYYGSYACQVCNTNLSDIYGAVAEHLIHVHHIKPLSEIGESYIVDPISDLIPVCPNCHSVLHRKNPPYLPDEIITMLHENKI